MVPVNVDHTDSVRSETISSLNQVAVKAAAWLLERLGPHGRPIGADRANSWWRVPWALSVAGHRGAAASVLSWAEQYAITEDGDLRGGSFGGGSVPSPVYKLAHLAIAAHMLNRYDTASVIYERILHYTDPETGGVYALSEPVDGRQEWLLTSQLGILSVQMGNLDVARSVYEWFQAAWAAQPEISGGRLYTTWADGRLITSLSADGRAAAVVDFNRARQAYFQPGAAAAFLANYAGRVRSRHPVALATEMLQLNLDGSPAQFDDPNSVQICKFGWGAAEMLTADPDGGWAAHVHRMAAWFEERQEADGSWAPSAFTLTGPPDDSDRMWKTAEHLMEVVQMITALSGSK